PDPPGPRGVRPARRPGTIRGGRGQVPRGAGGFRRRAQGPGHRVEAKPDCDAVLCLTFEAAAGPRPAAPGGRVLTESGQPVSRMTFVPNMNQTQSPSSYLVPMVVENTGRGERAFAICSRVLKAHVVSICTR